MSKACFHLNACWKWHSADINLFFHRCFKRERKKTPPKWISSIFVVWVCRIKVQVDSRSKISLVYWKSRINSTWRTVWVPLRLEKHEPAVFLFPFCQIHSAQCPYRFCPRVKWCLYVYTNPLYVANCYTTLQHLRMTNIYLNSHKTIDSWGVSVGKRSISAPCCLSWTQGFWLSKCLKCGVFKRIGSSSPGPELGLGAAVGLEENKNNCWSRVFSMYGFNWTYRYPLQELLDLMRFIVL